MKYVLIIITLIVTFIGVSITYSLQSLKKMNASVAQSSETSPDTSSSINLDKKSIDEMTPTLNAMLDKNQINVQQPDRAVASTLLPRDSLQDIKNSLSSLSRNNEKFDERQELLQVLASGNYSNSDSHEVALQEMKSIISSIRDISKNPQAEHYMTVSHQIALASTQDKSEAMQFTLDAMKSTQENERELRNKLRVQFINQFPELEQQFHQVLAEQKITTYSEN